MTRAVETATASTTLQAAALKMREASVGMLPVLDGARVVGVVTDRDIAVRGAADGRDPKKSTVAEVMTRDLVHCSGEDSTEEAWRIMEANTVRRLVVLDANERLAGVISCDDLAALEVEDELEPALDLRGDRSPSP